MGYGPVSSVDSANIDSTPIIGSGVDGQAIYLMACHKSGDERIYLMGSNDGVKFNLINTNNIFNPTTGNQRDPSITYYKGKYYIAHTNSTNKFFTVLVSENLSNWAKLIDVDMTAITNLNLVWAPEWFVDDDGSIRVFVSCSTEGSTMNFQIYEVHPTNDTMSTWSVPVAIAGTGFRTNMIDPYVVKIGSTYYMFFKNDNTKYIECLSSASLLSGWSLLKSGNWAGWGSGVEAPCIIKVGTNRWRMYMNQNDGLDSVAIYYSESMDDWETWSTKEKINTPWVLAHPTVLPVSSLIATRNIFAQYIQGRHTIGTVMDKSSSQSIAASTGTAISFDTIITDDLSSRSPGVTTKLTAASAGWYMVGAHLKCSDVSGGKRVMDIRINGVHYRGTISFAATADCPGPDLTTNIPYYLNAGDYIEVILWHNASSSVSVTAGQLWMVKI